MRRATTTSMSPEAPHLLAGSPFELGRAHGRAYGDVIARQVRENLQSISILAERRTGRPLPPEQILATSRQYLDLLEEHLPDLHEETRGIADGAGLPLLEVFTLNGYLDLYDLTFPRSEDAAVRRGGCTAFAIRDRHLDGEWSIVGQNYDVRTFLQDGVFLADIRPDGAPRALVATMAGMVGCAGANEAGIAVVINNLTPTDAAPGLFHQYIVRHVLCAETLGDAIDAVLGVPRASGFNYIVGDASGEFVGLETSSTAATPYHAGRDRFVCHCNHYVLDRMSGFEANRAFNGDSISRFGRAQSLLAELEPGDGVDGVMRLCRDHVNHPRSICRHPQHGDPLTEGKTVFSLLMSVQERRVSLCVGNPCQGTYTHHDY
jgi:isopenicillin-N N-acyltransferase-like protein